MIPENYSDVVDLREEGSVSALEDERKTEKSHQFLVSVELAIMACRIQIDVVMINPKTSYNLDEGKEAYEQVPVPDLGRIVGIKLSSEQLVLNKVHRFEGP